MTRLKICLNFLRRKLINFFNFYNEILRSWLLEQRENIENIMKLIFNLMKYMNHSERNKIWESLTEVRINSFMYF